MSCMALELRSYAHMEVWYKFRRVPTNILSLFKVQNFLRYLFVDVNHFWVVINHLVNALSWRFLEIVNTENISCESLSY